MTPTPIRIPPEQLSAAALRQVIEEFVTRDGTELTDAEVMIGQIRDQLDRGEVELWFDPETRTCNLLPGGQATPPAAESDSGPRQRPGP